jgi:hypothetical protein
MRNAHLRLGRLEYRRSSGKTDTKFSVPLDRYIGEDKDAHLISVYGGDAEVGAISSAIAERHTFTVYFPDGRSKVVGLGSDAVCYRGHINLPGRKRGARATSLVTAVKRNWVSTRITICTSWTFPTPAKPGYVARCVRCWFPDPLVKEDAWGGSIRRVR